MEIIKNKKEELDKLFILINNGYTKQNIENTIKEHNDIIKKTSKLNTFDSDKWNILKNDYMKIKKNITYNKYLLKQIIILYSSIINYYNKDIRENINNNISKISKNNDIIRFYFEELKYIHKETSIKRYYVLKNKKKVSNT
jgi:hypothetical protein